LAREQAAATTKARRGAGAGRVPGAEDFTRRSIYRAVLKDTLQHPLTLMPAVASALSGLYMGLFGLDPTTLAVTFGGALVGAGAWVFNYFIRGEALAEKRVAKLRQARARQQHAEIASLEAEWAQTGLAEGVQQARELREAFQKLDGFLEGRLADAGGITNPDRGLSVQRLRVLAEDTYREGAAILRSALETFKAVQQVDHDKLENELASWRQELRAVKATGAEAIRVESLEKRIASHERRLELLRERAQSIDQLFAESEALESALESTYLEAVDLKSPEVLLGQGQAASALERAVSAARRVEDRLRGMDGTKEDEELYLTAGEGRVE